MNLSTQPNAEAFVRYAEVSNRIEEFASPFPRFDPKQSRRREPGEGGIEFRFLRLS
jgi:hypothetical protein